MMPFKMQDAIAAMSNVKIKIISHARNISVDLTDRWHHIQSLAVKYIQFHRQTKSRIDESIALLLRDRERMVLELAQIRRQLEVFGGQNKQLGNNHSSEKLTLERDHAISEASQLRQDLKALQKDRDEIVKDRQRLWEEYQKLAQSRDELRAALEAKEGGSSV